MDSGIQADIILRNKSRIQNCLGKASKLISEHKGFSLLNQIRTKNIEKSIKVIRKIDQSISGNDENCQYDGQTLKRITKYLNKFDKIRSEDENKSSLKIDSIICSDPWIVMCLYLNKNLKVI